MQDLVGNPEDWFSRVAAEIFLQYQRSSQGEVILKLDFFSLNQRCF